jgi:Uncharacterized ACR, COG1430.
VKIIKIDHLYRADNFFKKFIGYMFQQRPQDIEVIRFEKCNSIHTFNMKFEIDVLFLDEEDRVIKRCLSVPKGKIINPVKGAVSVVEAPDGLFAHVYENEIIYFDVLSNC